MNNEQFIMNNCSLFVVHRFLNEIIWKRGAVKGAKATSKKYGRITDSILFYTKDTGYHFETPYKPIDINSPSDEGSVILDAFCGCGTTVAVAENNEQITLF